MCLRTLEGPQALGGSMRLALLFWLAFPIIAFAQYDPSQQSAYSPKSPSAVARFTAQGLKIGDRPTRAFMAQAGMKDADLAKPEWNSRHVIEVPSGEVIQHLGFMHGRLAVVSILFD